MNQHSIFAAVIQTTILLSAALAANQVLRRYAGARLVVCRAAFVATAILLIGTPWLASRPKPVVPVDLPTWTLASLPAAGSNAHGAPRIVVGAKPVSGHVATQEAISASGIDIAVLATGIWLAGVGVLAAILALGYRQLEGIRRCSDSVMSGPVVDFVHRVSRESGIKPPAIRTSSNVETPFVAGIWRPTLYLPACWTDTVDAATLEAVCRHEVAHIAANDLQWGLAYRLGTILFWPQPLLWLVGRSAVIASEEICDQRVIASGCSPQAYALSLLALRQGLGNSRIVTPVGIGAVSIRSAFGKRIEAIMDSSGNLRRELSRPGLLGLLLTCGTAAVLTETLIAAPTTGKKQATDVQAPSGPQTRTQVPGTGQADAQGPAKYGFSDLAVWDDGSGEPGNDGFVIGKDLKVLHNGHPTGTMKSTSPSPDGCMIQEIKADAYRGKRIRLRGFLKTKDVANFAGLWLRVDGIDHTLGFDNMESRHVKGTTDWTAYSEVLDVPKDAVAIALGAIMEGSGQVWTADFVLDKVDPAKVATTGRPSAPDASKDPSVPQNLNFRTSSLSVSMLGAAGWQVSGGTWDDKVRLDKATKRNDDPSVCLQNVTPGTMRATFQEIRANAYRGKRVEFQAYLKSAGDVKAGAFVAVPSGQWAHAFFQPAGKGWQLVSAVMDVPTWATAIQMGFEMFQGGQLWATDGSFKVVDPKTTPVTYAQPLAIQWKQDDLEHLDTAPDNMNFEQ